MTVKYYGVVTQVVTNTPHAYASWIAKGHTVELNYITFLVKQCHGNLLGTKDYWIKVRFSFMVVKHNKHW